MRFAPPIARFAFPIAWSALLLAASSITARSQVLWTVGIDDTIFNFEALNPGDGGGPNATFVQESGVNPLPGNPNSPELDTQADDDYYFAGEYTTVIEANGAYDPVGTVEFDEEAVERAFGGGDNDLRYHFNLPSTLQPTDRLAVTFDAISLDGGKPDSRYGIEVFVNGELVQQEIIIRPAQIGIDYQTSQFTLASVGAQVGPGFDNIVSLRGTNYNGDGGGNWMGIDYVQLAQVTEVIPPAVFPWAVGLDDDAWPLGNGGGANASFVQEDGVTNPLPGNPASPEVAQQADNDYYFAGSFTTAIPGNGAYAPVGLVPANEEAAERTLSAGETELRYHCNLPNALTPTSLIAVTFDASVLDAAVGAAAHYGVEVYFNNVLVCPEIAIRSTQLGKDYTTPQFSLGSVNAVIGSGFDNIMTLRGVNHSATGGGSLVSIDYVQLNPVTTPVAPSVLPWAVGLNDNSWPLGDGGGANASFVEPNGTPNPMPGSPVSTEVSGGADNDYYFAGNYLSVVAGNGVYDPVGAVVANEEAAERGFSGSDNELRYHFNLPPLLPSNYLVSVSFDALDLDTGGADPRYGVEVYVNGVLVQPQVLIRPAQLGTTVTTPPFTLASVNARVGPGFDNIVSLKGINFNADGGGNRLGIDYLQLNAIPTITFPWTVGKDDDGWPVGNGGGANATFVQEAGVNGLPGRPDNPEFDTQADDDYYLAGIFSSVIESNGVYDPVGVVLLNEEAAERAFAGTDNDKRYHFNLPNTLQPNDVLSVAFDMFNLDTRPANTDPRYGIEVYFNETLVQEEIVIRPGEIDKYYATPPFTLASVNAQVGSGSDNIVRLRGVSYSGDGGGEWMGIDYVKLSPVISAGFPLTVGLDDNAQPAGDGGGANATFVQEGNGITPLPGTPVSPEVDQQADNDYYFAGLYSTPISSVVASYGDYTPVGLVGVNEEAAERALAAADNDLRYHFNLPGSFLPTDKLSVAFDAVSLDMGDPPTRPVPDPRYGVEVYFNGVLVQEQILVRPADLDTDYTTEEFTLASVNAQVGPGADNIVSLKGINYNADGGGNWMGIDYVQINGSVPTTLVPPTATVNNGQVTLSWTGAGNLEWSSTLVPPWTPITPPPPSPYTEPLAPEGLRYYRLRSP